MCCTTMNMLYNFINWFHIFFNSKKTYSKSGCPVCFENILVNPVETLCGHTFCKECLNSWLSRENSCPMCRKFNPSISH